MSCILCLSYVAEEERLSIYDYAEQSRITATELIQAHLKFADVSEFPI